MPGRWPPFASATSAAGFAVFGPLADRFGVTPALIVAASMLAVTSLVALVPGVRSVRRTPDGKIVAESAA